MPVIKAAPFKQIMGRIPRYVVQWEHPQGTPHMSSYYAEHHAEQFCRALRLNGLNAIVIDRLQPTSEKSQS